MAAAAIPSRNSAGATPASAPSRSCSSSRAVAPRMAGIDIRNESRAAATGRMPAAMPAAIVSPERESPGSTASPCASPIQRPTTSGTLATSSVPPRPRESQSTPAVTSSPTPVICSEPSQPLAKASKLKPIIAVGMLASSTSCTVRSSGSVVPVRTARSAAGVARSAPAMSVRSSQPAASSVPRCSAMLKKSGGRTPLRCSKITKWPLLLTGSHSVSPCTMPSSNAIAGSIARRVATFI